MDGRLDLLNEAQACRVGWGMEHLMVLIRWKYIAWEGGAVSGSIHSLIRAAPKTSNYTMDTNTHTNVHTNITVLDNKCWLSTIRVRHDSFKEELSDWKI